MLSTRMIRSISRLSTYKTHVFISKNFSASASIPKTTFPSSHPTSTSEIHSTNSFKSSIPNELIDHQYTTLVEMAQMSFEKYAKKNVFGTRVGNNYEWITYEQFHKEVLKFRNVLHHHKFGYNDKLAIISNNRLEWAVAAFAAQSLGGQMVPMYEVQLEKDWKYIIQDSGADVLLVSTEKIYEKVSSYPGNVGTITSVLCMDAPVELMHSYKRWMSLVTNETPVPIYFPKPHDLCTIIYTSGTTGNPKGVKLSHANIVSNLHGIVKISGQAGTNNTSLAFLPWAHVYGQSAELFALFSNGSSMGIVPNRETIVESINLIKPTVICAVPALFNKVYDGIKKKFSEESKTKQSLINYAFKVSRIRNNCLEFNRSVPILIKLQHYLFDKIIFKKIRERLGGNIRYMTAGGAATTKEVLQFFEDIGIPIANGYGLTETSPIVSLSSIDWSNRRIDTVGVLLDGVSAIFIDPDTFDEVPNGKDGELCVSGPNVMLGYHNNQKATDEVFLIKNGIKYFRTGDLAHMEEGKFLKITGRIKEQFKLENGKYVVPVPVEDHICRSTFIAQALLYGANRKATVLLVVPDWIEIRAWALRNNILGAADSSPSSLMKDSAVQDLLTNEIETASSTLKSYERPFSFDIIEEPFSQENQMLTPKMSIRRPNIVNAYQNKIDAMYTNSGGMKLKVLRSAKGKEEE